MARSTLFTPESVIDIQRSIGADIIMAFDECPPYPSPRDYVDKSMQLTHRWLDRCISTVQRNRAEIWPFSQMLCSRLSRAGLSGTSGRNQLNTIAAKGADGNAIGGLSVGEPEDSMYEMTELVCEILPKDKPRYLMGVGTPVNMLQQHRPGHRHVRLRDAHPQWKKWHDLHPEWHHQHEK